MTVDATVVISLLSFTLKKQVNIQAPIAKTAIKISKVIVNFGDTGLK